MMYGVSAGLWLVFFFQAEDGIRDVTVTGVQTCALPICGKKSRRKGDRPLRDGRIQAARVEDGAPDRGTDGRLLRRAQGQIGRACVGKECRSRWAPYQ